MPIQDPTQEPAQQQCKPIGPLTVQPCQWNHGSSIVICHRERGIVAEIEPLDKDDDTDSANARREPYDFAYASLFAAAPALYSALEGIMDLPEMAAWVDHIRAGVGTGTPYGQRIKAAMDAIALADNVDAVRF